MESAHDEPHRHETAAMIRGERFSTWQLLVGTACVVAYVLLAELVGFWLITLPLPGRHPMLHRVSECGLIWTLAWTAMGWVSVLRRRESNLCRQASVAILVPTFSAIPEASGEAWLQLHRASPPCTGWVRWAMMSMPVYPLLNGILLSGCLFAQVRIWRHLTRKGVCLTCGYNLTGLTEPRCPECRTGFAE